jgi:glycerate dehydrogenase
VWQGTDAGDVKVRITGADVVILNKIKIHEGVLPDGDACPRLICVSATGYDNIDLRACRARGVAVANVRGYSTESVTQVTVGLVLSLTSHLAAYASYVSDGSYTRGGVANRLSPTYHEIAGKTWGIVGAGKIGGRVAEVARALGCRVLTCRRHPDGESVDLDTVCRESDIITVHCPLTDETRGMIDERRLALMKPDVILVNMARGAVTDEGAIADAVTGGRLGGFGCDVYAVEPFGENHPYFAIRNHERVCLLPHMAWGAYEARERCLAEMIENIEAFLNGEARNRIDIDA